MRISFTLKTNGGKKECRKNPIKKMQMGGTYRNQKGRYQKNGYQQFQVSVGWQVGHQKVDREVNFFSDAIFVPHTQHCFPDLLKTQ